MIDLPIPDYYAVLGVPSDASIDEIRQARNREAKFWYPDLYPGQSDYDRERRTKMSVQINAAWETLRDEDTRREYDSILIELKSLGLQFAVVVSGNGLGNYSSIMDAVQNNTMNYPIIVLGGTYEESIVIDRSCTIIGLSSISASEVCIKSDDICLSVLNGSASLVGLTLRNVGQDACVSVRGGSLKLNDCVISAGRGSSAVDIGGGQSEVRIQSSVITCGSGAGIYAFHGAKVELTDCKIKICNSQGINLNHFVKLSLRGTQIDRCTGGGIFASHKCDINIESSEVLDNGSHGIRISDSELFMNKVSVRGNVEDGVWCESGAQLKLTDSSIEKNRGDGIRLSQESEISMTSSMLSNNHGFEIYSAGGVSATIENSIIIHTESEDGIDLGEDSWMSLNNNIFVGGFLVREHLGPLFQLDLWDVDPDPVDYVRYVPQPIDTAPSAKLDVEQMIQLAEARASDGKWTAATKEAIAVLVASESSDLANRAHTIIRAAEYERRIVAAKDSYETGDFALATVSAQIALGIALNSSQREQANSLLRSALYHFALSDAEAKRLQGRLQEAVVAVVSALAVNQHGGMDQGVIGLARTLTAMVALNSAKRCSDVGNWGEVELWAGIAASIGGDASSVSEAHQFIDLARANHNRSSICELLSREAWQEALRVATAALGSEKSAEERAFLRGAITRCEFRLACDAARTGIASRDWEGAEAHLRRASALAVSLEDCAITVRLDHEIERGESSDRALSRARSWSQDQTLHRASWSILVGIAIFGLAAVGALIGIGVFLVAPR